MNGRTGDGHQTQLEAGSRTFNGPRRIHVPKPIILATNQGGGEDSFTAVVKLPVPSSQARVKLSVIFYPSSGALGDIHGIGTIWVAACEEDNAGIAGSGGRLVPVTDVEGTSTAPTSFPQTNGLGGYSREFVTAADWLQATVFLQSLSAPGVWVLQTSIQPDAVNFDWDSWEQIRRLFVPQLAGPSGFL
jgi:hypothetical protein